MADSPLQLPPDPAAESGVDASGLNRSTWGRQSWFEFKPMNWLWVLPTLLVSGGASYWAVQNLLSLPDIPGCYSVNRTTEPTSIRLYCANQVADGKSVENLRKAIQLINSIPLDDTLRPESDRLVEEWTRQMLELGDEKFQQGDLKQATEIADKIPPHLKTQQMIEERTRQWRSIWDRAEAIFDDAQDNLDQRKWAAAINIAKGLLTVGNQYWATSKHQELMQQIEAAQDMQKMQANQPNRRSTARTVSTADPIEDFFTQRDQERAAEASGYLSRAYNLAGTGNLSGLESAIDEAQKVMFGTPRYDEAQQAIEQWQREIEVIQDRPYLDRALSLAQKGDLNSLEAAIQEADQIIWGRALYDSAQTHIEQWRTQVSQLQLQQTESDDGSNSYYPTDSQPFTPDAVPAPVAVPASDRSQ